MIKKFFAPFSSKATEAKKNDNQMFFFELYFYVLLPYGMYYYGELVYYYITTYNRTNLPFYTLFLDSERSMMFIFAVLPLLCITWQFFSLRTFSSHFFIALWCFLAAFIVFNIAYYIIIKNTACLINACWSIPYGCVIFYFYNRKHLFDQTKKNNMSAED